MVELITTFRQLSRISEYDTEQDYQNVFGVLLNDYLSFLVESMPKQSTAQQQVVQKFEQIIQGTKNPEDMIKKTQGLIDGAYGSEQQSKFISQAVQSVFAKTVPKLLEQGAFEKQKLMSFLEKLDANIKSALAAENLKQSAGKDSESQLKSLAARFADLR